MSTEQVENKHILASSEDPLEIAGFIERLKRHTETYGSSLYDLFSKEGNSDTFREILEDLVAEIAFEDPTYASNAEKLRNPRLKDEEGKRLIAEQRAMAERIKQLVIQEAGIPTEEARTDIETAQAAVFDRLQGTDLAMVDADELLRKVGILQEDEHGDAVFHYPEDLFPESINDKWRLYLVAVENHMGIGNEVRRGGRAPKDLETADSARKFAHDRISEDMHEILGFKNLPEEQWGFKRTRELVAKMREAKFVGKQTGESVVTSQALARGMGAFSLSVLGKLSQRK